MRKPSLLFALPVVAVTATLMGCSGTGVGTAANDGGVEDASADDASPVVDGGPSSPSVPPTAPTSTAKKPAPRCSSEGGFEGTSGSCTLQTTYQCETPSGFDAYRVACSCPSASCGCYLNGTLTKTVQFNGCPSCSSPVELAKLCGVAGY
jgi:hypothetical protein